MVKSPEVERAVGVLREGGLVAFPTETVYGLGADAASDAALAHLYAVKGRPAGHPVIVHVAGVDEIDRHAAASADTSVAQRLAEAFWPGPLTLVVERRPGVVSDRATGGQDTVALRASAHSTAAALVAGFGGAGIAAPSANRFGRVSPTTAQHVHGDLGSDVDLVLDGGPSAVGVESTILDLSAQRPRLLREGGVVVERLAQVLGAMPERAGGDAPRVSGSLPSHYAPRARVELAADLETALARAHELGEAQVLAAGAPADHLPVPRDPEGFARVLYARLRDADVRGLRAVVAVAPPSEGVGAAVADRLRRAATPRER